MADFVFVLKLAGFQYGDLFNVHPQTYQDRPGTQWACTDLYFKHTFLFVPQRSRHTNVPYLTTRSVHGIALGGPGQPPTLDACYRQPSSQQFLVPSVPCLAVPAVLEDTCTYKGHTEDPVAGQPPVPAEGLFANVLIRDLPNYGWPPAHRMFGRRARTDVTASLLASW